MKKIIKKKMTIFLAGLAITVIGGGSSFHDVIEYNGLPLLAEKIHMKKGLHRVVINEQFYETLSFNTREKLQKSAIKGIKAAYDRLNEVNTGIQFELCTTVPTIAIDYSLRKINDVDSVNDIILYLSRETIEGHEKACAFANCHWDSITREMDNPSITYHKPSILAKWESGKEKELEASNCCSYSITIHETLHLMGFDHKENEESILYYLDASARDLSQDDIEMIKRYNQFFYGYSKENKINLLGEPILEKETDNLIF